MIADSTMRAGTFYKLSPRRETRALNHGMPLRRTVKWLKYVIRQERSSRLSITDLTRCRSNILNFVRTNQDKLPARAYSVIRNRFDIVLTPEEFKDSLIQIHRDLKDQIRTARDGLSDTDSSQNTMLVRFIICGVAFCLLLLLFHKVIS